MTTNQPPALYRRDPRRAFLSAYFEDAYRDAFTACKEVLNRGVLWMACLVRETVPDATSVTVDVAEQKLLSVHAGDRKVWEAGKDQGPLTQPHVDDIEDVLRDVLDFGRTPVAFTEVGWQPTSDTARYGIALPDTSQPGEPTAARVGAAHTATPAGLLEVIAALEPGDASFTVEGLPAYARETRDRVRAALLNAGYDSSRTARRPAPRSTWPPRARSSSPPAASTTPPWTMWCCSACSAWTGVSAALRNCRASRRPWPASVAGS